MTDYYEMVISGSFLYVKGLITGLCIGANKKPDVIFNKEHNIERETLGEILKELVGLSDILVHVILPENLFEFLKDKLSKKTTGVKIKSTKMIISAEFEFDFEAYTEKHKEQLKEIFDNPPGDVKFSDDTKIQEKVYNDSEGIEVYTPAHNFEYTGRGRLKGSFPYVFEMFKKSVDHSLINVGKMHLNF